MPLVAFDVMSDDANPLRVEPATTLAVPAQPYAHIVAEETGNPGVIIRALVVDDHICRLGEFQDGAQVYIEGEPGELLYLDEPEHGRMWWRATVIER